MSESYKTRYKRFSELPLNDFNGLKESIYILDFKWNYMFVNDSVKKNLGNRGEGLIGKNMWSQFNELAIDPVFNSLKDNMDQKMAISVVTTSPVTGQRLSIIGYPLEDCFYFSSAILPKKEVLLRDLKF